MIKTKSRLLILIALVSLGSCGNYEESKGFIESGSAGLGAGQEVSFADVSEQIFSTKCTSCHLQYENYSAVVAELGAIRSAVESNRMPKNMPALTSAQKALLFAWIDAGAPDRVDGGNTDPIGDTALTPTWKSLAQNVFYPKCTSCHNPNGQASFLDLSTRQAWFDGRDRDFGGITLLDFDNPEESYLMEVINDPLEPMPPVWSNIPELSVQEKEVLVQWIRLGLP